MQAIKVDLNQSKDGSYCDPGIAIEFSFRPFINYVVKRIEKDKMAKVVFYQYILNKFKAQPELWESLPVNEVPRYAPMFDLIYGALSPLLDEEANQLWAVGLPLSPCFFSGTDAFYNTLLEADTKKLRSGLDLPSPEQMRKSALASFYHLVLERYYDYPYSDRLFTVKAIADADTNLMKYYRFNVDNRFIEVDYLAELPVLELAQIKDRVFSNGTSLDILQKLLPVENFRIRGLSIVHLEDITSEYSIENLKNVIIRHNQSEGTAHGSAISLALKTLVGCERVQFGVLPNIQLNGQVIFNDDCGFVSIIAEKARQEPANMERYRQLVDAYLKDPKRLLFPEITAEESEKYPLMGMLNQHGVNSYALFPLHHNGRIVGCLEVYTEDASVFKGYTLSKLETAFPYLAQLCQNLISNFNYSITKVIREQFTALQPAVRWRFNEAAYRYLSSGAAKNNLPIERVYFENVHPFYGAVDIRDSSALRNQATRADLLLSFGLLGKLLTSLQCVLGTQAQGQLHDVVEILPAARVHELSDREVFQTEGYLQRQLPQHLEAFAAAHPQARVLVDDYLREMHDRSEVYKNSVGYEQSMQRINQAVTIHLERFNESVQAIFPCYFERFRTDGVEYDLYMGQSIAPHLPMPANLLGSLRFKQLQMMAEIGRSTFALTSELELPMQTTQLIFVYEKPIDISFRKDEQRFDVEGSYNIRYQMVKKRIDKAHVKGTLDRLTQPGKITIVFFNSWEAQEYKTYIKKLEQQGLLKDDLEVLEVEELQGVQGLKAMRVGIEMLTSTS